MKVGFGAAGVEIIRNNLAKGESKDGLVLNTQGTTVKCIFLFCDIRQFTDATESLQEEVFVFTNKIASVIHSICNSYGGSANKNVGDAFLMSWLLEDESKQKKPKLGNRSFVNSFDAENQEMECQADKALFAVVRICIALYHDQYYIETLSNEARQRLLKKIGKRHGPVVQMGFGLHMGKAVQGAIGSERKLDATYISEAVEFAEFLESSTKQYGLKMLMSDAFYDLLDPANRRRCRKIDQLFIPDEEEEGYLDGIELVDISEKIELYTYDMDLEAMWREPMEKAAARARHDVGSEHASDHEYSVSMGSSFLMPPRTGGTPTKKINRRMQMIKGSVGGLGSLRDIRGPVGASVPARPGMIRRSSLMGIGIMKNSDGSRDAALRSSDLLKRNPSLLEFDYGELNDRGVPSVMPPLVLPSSNAMYNPGVWNSREMKKIRQRFSDGLFFQKFSEGLQAYYSKDWDQAKRCFRTILDRIEDGPSRYFMNQMDEYGGVPPRNFLPYGRV
jgi:class 3 adenylate cyclase